MKSWIRYTLTAALTVAAMAPVQAGIMNTFTDRASWDTAVGAGNFVTEDFDGASFRQLANDTVEDVGTFNVFYTTTGNVDESVNAVFDSSGSQIGGLLVDDYLRLEWDIDGADMTTALEFRFDSPVNAFAANFVGVDAPDDLSLTLDGEAVNLHDALGSTASGFLGWTLDNAVTSIAFSAAGIDSFQVDFVSLGNVSAVPVPAAVWLFGSALIGLLGFRHKKV